MKTQKKSVEQEKKKEAEEESQKRRGEEKILNVKGNGKFVRWSRIGQRRSMVRVRRGRLSDGFGSRRAYVSLQKRAARPP